MNGFNRPATGTFYGSLRKWVFYGIIGLSLMAVLGLGCTTAATQKITVRPGPPPANIKPKPQADGSGSLAEKAGAPSEKAEIRSDSAAKVSEKDRTREKTRQKLEAADDAREREVKTSVAATGEVNPFVPGANTLEEITVSQVEEQKPPRESRLAEPYFQNPGPDEQKVLLPKPSEKRYSLTMRDSDVKSVLMSFSREGEYNVIVDPDITGTVTMDIKEMNLDQALDAILLPLGFTYQKNGSTIRIFKFKPKLETRAFTLNYLATVRKSKSAVRADTSGSVQEKDKSTETMTENTSDLWTDLQSGLQNMLSKDGKFFLNRVASAVIVTDYPPNLQKVAEFLEMVEGTVQRQVLIEASIIEVSLSDEYKMGLNWKQALGDGRLDSNELPLSRLDSKTFIPLPDPGLFATRVFQFTFDIGHLAGLLQALSQQGKTELLSKPRITTLNNQTAMIKVGTEDVYFEQEQQTTITGQSTTLKARFFTVGMIMDVTPQIGPGDEITMHVHPVVTEKVSEKTQPLISTGQTIEIKIPILSVRESSSVVKVKSGQTLLIAGLLMDKNKEVVTGIPRLKDLPLFGPLFRYKTIEKEKTELVVTLTPTILVGKKVEEVINDQISHIIQSDLNAGTGATRK